MEFKHSSKAPRDGSVHPNHAIQVIAYRALVEDGERVTYGLVIYAGHQASPVEYNRANKRWLKEVINEMRKASTLEVVNRNHKVRGRCAGCGVRYACTQRL